MGYREDSDKSKQPGRTYDKHCDSAFRPHGGYRKLRSFQVTQVIYDGTVSFCNRFIDKRSRTHDQMLQAARSGRQNIAEGSRASATSAKSEIMLVNVARASLDELLLDYEDFLRQRGLRQWKKEDPEALEIREVGRKQSDRTDQTDVTDRSDEVDPSIPYLPWLNHPDPAIVANALICLIHQANYLIDHQLAGLERQFASEGGFSEKLAMIRRNAKLNNKSDRTDLSDPSDRSASPICPSCGKAMILRTARQGASPGSNFWGCSAYPNCRGTRQLEKSTNT
ncbi:MAG TPA: four helix bundle protein [Lentisphaeria bacterium]|nr:four helix bundle protein [Lentisphaeria bacterium]